MNEYLRFLFLGAPSFSGWGGELGNPLSASVRLVHSGLLHRGGAGGAWPLTAPQRVGGRAAANRAPQILDRLKRGSEGDGAAPKPRHGNSPSLRQGRVSTLKLLSPLPAAAIVEPPKPPLPLSPQPPAGELAGVEVARRQTQSLPPPPRRRCRRRRKGGGGGGGGGGREGSFLRGSLCHRRCDCARRRQRREARTIALAPRSP